jgi:hypothetical protein
MHHFIYTCHTSGACFFRSGTWTLEIPPTAHVCPGSRCRTDWSVFQSQSHITTDGQSVIMSRYRAHSGTCDQILLSVRRVFHEICSLVSVGRPIWREVRSIICLSQSSNLPLFTSNIYVTCVLQFSNVYTINIKLQSVPSECSRLCSTSYSYVLIIHIRWIDCIIIGVK